AATVSLPDSVVGEPYSVSLSASPTGKEPYDLSVSNTPPDGMTFTVVSNHTSDAYVLLTASDNVIPGQRQRFTVFATDAAGGNADEVYDVRVVNPPPQILTTRVELKTGVPVELALQATNGQGPLSWTFVDGPLPDGVQIDTNGVVAGTPTPDASELQENGL